MEYILDGLKKKEIISAKNINDIREYINKKYPDLPAGKRSGILANSINSILDKNMPDIESLDNIKIKSDILREAVHKKSFSINAYDILKSFLPLIKNKEENMNCLIEWVNSCQDRDFTIEQLKELISHDIKFMPFEKPDNISDVKRDESGGDFKHHENDTCNKMEPAEPQHIHESILKSGFIFKPLLSIMRNKKTVLVASIALFLLVTVSGIYNIRYNRNSFAEAYASVSGSNLSGVDSTAHGNKLPIEYRYRDVNKDIMKAWLNKRDSILSDEPYISAIMETAKQYDINPLLMFAITGQEQSFVPRSNTNSKAIANNPFNVYGSWKDYNTDIYDSSSIASRTIITISRDRPSNADCIQWINRKYAEDTNWHLGVAAIFNQLTREVGSR